MKIRKTIWQNSAEPVIAVMIVLCVLGTLNVFSSSFVLATTDFENPYYFLGRHVIWLVMGIVICVLFAHMNYHRWQSPVGTVGFFTVVALMLVGVLFFGTVVNGARRWLTAGGFSIQPAEFAKLFGIILVSKSLATAIRVKKYASVFTNPAYGAIFVLFALIMLEPDMGTACIVMGVPVLMAFIVGTRQWEWLSILLGVPSLFIILVYLQPYRMERIRVMYDPWADAQGAGYQAVQSLSTIGSGGLFGMGMGEGVSKYAYLPEAHTDFAFAIFAQEHGYLGALVVFALFVALVLLCARISARARDAYGQVLALGVMLLVAGQAAANLAMVGGMFAVVGIPLPFISYGGSSLIVTMAAMGILLNICKHSITPDERRMLEQQERAARQREIIAKQNDGEKTLRRIK